MDLLYKPYTITLELYNSWPNTTAVVYTKGDVNAYPLEMQLTAHGEPYDLTGCTANLVVQRPSGTADKAACTILDAENGLLHYDILGSEISEPGMCTATVEVTTADELLTWTGGFTFTVVPSLDENGSEPPEAMTDWVKSIDMQIAGQNEKINSFDIETGTTETISPGSPAVVTKRDGSSSPAVFDFKIPQGKKGEDADIAAAEEAATSANTAATSANQAAAGAVTATGNANTAAENANTEAAYAKQVGDDLTASKNAGEFTGAQGYSVSITEDPGNTNTVYKLDVHNDNPAIPDFVTPNLIPDAAVVTRYGVKFAGGANTGATVTRLYNAEGLVAGVGTDTQTARNDFDNIDPWMTMKKTKSCGYFDFKGKWVVNAFEGEPGFAYDGSNGEIFEYIKPFYYLDNIDVTTGELAGVAAISEYPINGYTYWPGKWVACYQLATVNGKATSRSGVFSDSGSLNSLMTAARTLGENYTTTTADEVYIRCLLMWVEFATRNLQSVMYGAANMPYVATDTNLKAGSNKVYLANAKADAYTIGQTIGIGTEPGEASVASNRIITSIVPYSEVNKEITFDGAAVTTAMGNVIWSSAWINGSCDSVLSSSGSPVSNTDGKHNCTYRGIETPYGNAYEWISDVLFKREGEAGSNIFDVYYLPDPTKYNSGNITADYIKLNYQLPPADGYVTKLGFDARYPFLRLPATAGGSSTTYYSDNYYAPLTGSSYAACISGYWSLGASVGPCCWYCRALASGSGVNRRARLSYHQT